MDKERMILVEKLAIENLSEDIFRYPRIKDFDTNDFFRSNDINGWVREINNLLKDIHFTFGYIKSYHIVSKDYDYAIYKRNLNINNILSYIFSFKDKCSYLFCELFNIDLGEKEFNKLNFSILSNKSKGIDLDKLTILIEGVDELYKSKLKEYRNSNIHRQTIGIDNFGSGMIKKRIKGEKIEVRKEKKIINSSIDTESKEVLEKFKNFPTRDIIMYSYERISYNTIIDEIEGFISRLNELVDNININMSELMKNGNEFKNKHKTIN